TIKTMALMPPSVFALKITSTPASAPSRHFRLTLHSSCQTCVRQFRDHRFRLTDRNEAFVDYLVVVAEADVAVLERQRIDGPFAACLGDGALLPKSPSAAAFALEQQHRQTSAADDGCRIDVGERGLERRQGGERTSRWRGGNLLASGLVVFAIVVGVIAVAIGVVITHALSPFWKVSSASANARAVSTRPGTGACAFSIRTSEMPERFETMRSSGILRPRAFALSSTCLGERISASTMSS